MIRTCPVLLLAACCGLLPDPAPGEEPGAGEGRQLKVVARGPWPHLPTHSPAPAARKQQQWVFRDEKELAQVAGPHGPRLVARALKADAIDFKEQMLLVVADGT